MNGPHHLLVINNNNGNNINLSIEATEVPFNVAIQNENRRIDRQIINRNNQQAIRFGQAQPVLAGGLRGYTSVYPLKTIKCLGIMALLLLTFLGGIYLGSYTSSLKREDTSSNKYYGAMMKEEDVCDLSQAVLENNLINNEIFSLITYDEPDIQEMFKGPEIIDIPTCAIYEILLHLFSQLCSLKDNIIDSIPTKLSNGIHSMNHVYAKSEQMSSTIDDNPSSQIEQNGAVSNEDVHAEKYPHSEGHQLT